MQKEVTIAGKPFTVSLPYLAGHVLNEAEAKTLNQVRTENIRNNMASKVKDGTAGEAEVAAYDAAYSFALQVGGTRKTTDPLEKECLALARANVTATIKKAGKKVKDFAEEKIEAMVEKLAEHPEIVKAAKARIRDREKLAEGLALDLSDAA